MRLPNGFGNVSKLPGNRRKPWRARKTIGWENDRQQFETIGYFSSKEEGIAALEQELNGSNVYFISDGDFVKIGKANNVEKRLKVLQTGNPKPLTIINIIECGDCKKAYELEFFLHKMLKPLKVNGEWYKLGG